MVRGNVEVSRQVSRYILVGLFVVIGALFAARIVSDVMSARSVSIVRFIIPNGFRGMFCVVEDPTGHRVHRTSDGSYVLEIPPSGEIVISDAAFLRATREIVQTIGGRRFSEIGWPPAPPFNEGIAYGSLSVTSDGHYCFLIGTEKEQWDYFNRTPRGIGTVDPVAIEEDVVSQYNGE